MANENIKIAVMLEAVDKISAMTKIATSKSLKNLTDFANKASKVSEKAFSFGKSAGAIGLGISAPLGLVIKAAQESEIATRRLNNVFKSMGDTTGKAAKQAADYASSLQMVIGVEDEDIMATQAKIATFSKVSDATARMTGVFDRATKASYDMAAVGFGSAIDNAVQLGKALQNPALGAQALAKAGALNKEDMPMIKHIQATKGLAAAQQFVLKAIEKQVGGTAKAIASPMAIARVGFSEVAESIGKMLLPQVNQLMKKVIPALKRIQDWVEKNKKLVTTIAMVASGAGALALAASALAFAVSGIAKAFQFAAISGKFLLSLTRQQTYVDMAAAVKKFALATATNAYTWALNAASLAMKVFGGIMKVITFIMNTNPIILIVTGIATAALLIYKYWEPIKKFFSNTFNAVKQTFWKALDFVKEWGVLLLGPIGFIYKLFSSEKFRNAGINIVKSIWEGIKSFAHKPIDAIKSMVTKIREFLPFSPAKTGPLRDIHKIRLVETIAASIKPHSLVKAMKLTTAAAMIAVNPMIGKGAGSIASKVSGGSVIHFTQNITVNGGSPSAKEDLKKALKENANELIKIIEEANRKSNRLKL